MQLNEIIDDVAEELKRATSQHGGFASWHEGYAVLLEEVEELWDEVKRKNRNVYAARKEAIQVAAMAVKFVAMIDDQVKP